MSLKTSYRFIAPFYDVCLDRVTRSTRQNSLAKLPQQGVARVLLSGAGTGLDFPFLPPRHEYTALDLTGAMLARAKKKATGLHMQWVRGDSMALPFASGSFDYAVLHLIMAVVSRPQYCLAETARVLRPGGHILLFDKFLRHGERAWVRRGLTPLMGRLATRLDVLFEEMLEAVPELKVLTDEPALANGWFRLIELHKDISEN